MHRLAAGFILGFHGCTVAVANRLLAGDAFRHSDNVYDWLGQGIYFWEANPDRALEFAREKIARERRRGAAPGHRSPAVVGAVIDPGLCLDLTTKAGIDAVHEAYETLRSTSASVGEDMPVNSTRFPLRPLDCAVVNHLHTLRRRDGQRVVQTVRGVFIEGRPPYPNAGFHEKTHIQIAVRDESSIKGVFRIDRLMGE